MPKRWPTIIDLLAWLRTVKLKGRAAMWQASAERILLAMTYGEFGAVLNTQDNSHVENLLDHNVILEMDGLSSSSDRAMFSEALTLYLYRHRLAQGPRDQLTNLIVLEEAHHILARRASEAKETVLETSIRMIRQYGIGYVFVDQSASLLSKVAFANSYATLALSQKLRADIQTIAGAMNLTEEQRNALSTLSIGSAVVRLADEHPEAFLLRIPRCPIREGAVSDFAIRTRMGGCFGESRLKRPPELKQTAVSAVPIPDKKPEINLNQAENTHPPSPGESSSHGDQSTDDCKPEPPPETMSREEIRFLADVAARPLSTTVSRYRRLHLSRRRANAVRQSLSKAGLIEAVPIATRSGQIVLSRLTDHGRSACCSLGIDPGPRPRASLEHAYWVMKVKEVFEKRGYDVMREHDIKGDGTVDLLAERPGERVAIEVETGKSDIKENLAKLRGKRVDRVVVVATSPAAVGACQKAIGAVDPGSAPAVELMTWLDVS